MEKSPLECLAFEDKGKGFEDETVLVGFVVGFCLFTWFFSCLAWRSPAHKSFMESIITVFVEISFPLPFTDGKLIVSFCPKD